MATLVSIANGNWTSSSTWALIDSTETDATGNLTVMDVQRDSSTFTPGAITVDAILIKFSHNNTTSTTNTLTVTLRNSTDSVDVSSVTVNVADIGSVRNALANFNIGWQVFKLATPVTLTAGKAYLIRTSALASEGALIAMASQFNLSNFYRAVRTTTTQAPAAGDKLYVTGELTGPGTSNTFTVTMNETASTVYGAVAFPDSLAITNKGVLAFSTAASQNLLLRVKGIISVYEGGIFTMGTVGSPIPSTSTAKLEFNNTGAGDSGLYITNYGTFTTCGATRSVVKTKLNADANAPATTLTTLASTGWLTGDEVAVAATVRVAAGQVEKVTLSANASGTSLTISSGLANLHHGTNPLKADLGLLTRNVKIYSTSSSVCGFIYCYPMSTVSLKFTELYFLGNNLGGKQGINVYNSNNPFIIDYCSMHDFIVAGNYGILTQPGYRLVTITNNVFYNVTGVNIFINTGTTSDYIIDNNLIIYCPSSGIISIKNPRGTVTNNIIANCAAFANGYALWMDGGENIENGNVSNNLIYVSNVDGIGFVDSANVTSMDIIMSNNTIARCNRGIFIRYFNGYKKPFVIDNLNIFGCVSESINVQRVSNIVFRNSSFASEALYSTNYGMQLIEYADLKFENCTFSNAFYDIFFNVTDSSYTNKITLNNCLLNSPTNVIMQSTTYHNFSNAVYSSNHQKVAGNYQTYKYRGIIKKDRGIYDASPSMRLTPNSLNTSVPLYTNDFSIPIASGVSRTLYAKVRESVVTDDGNTATKYNGNRIQMWARSNYNGGGYTTDTLLATASAASVGAWEVLSATLPTPTQDTVYDIYFTCDGSAGFVNIDTLQVI